VPSFRSTAARITEPTVGASVWASGSHVWNGHIGTFTANPSAIATQARTIASVDAPVAITAPKLRVAPRRTIADRRTQRRTNRTPGWIVITATAP